MALAPLIKIHDSADGRVKDMEDASRKQTPAELRAGIIPVNYAYLPGDVRRYGAVGDGTTDDLAAFQRAHDSFNGQGGAITIPPGIFKLDGTWELSDPMIHVHGGGCDDGGGTTATVLFSDTNAAIIEYTGNVNVFANLRNLAILGTLSSPLKTSQHGIVVNNTVAGSGGGIRISNVNIRNCGGSGLVILNSYVGTYKEMYISLCGGSGVLVNGNAGNNLYMKIDVAACGSAGFDFEAADGSDMLVCCDSEQNAYGFVFGSGVFGFYGVGLHSEANTTNSVLFKAGSDKNILHFAQRGGGAEPGVSNLGGSQNMVLGLHTNGTFIAPRCISRQYKPFFDVVTFASSTVMVYDNSTPTSTEGEEVMVTDTVTGVGVGNVWKITGTALLESDTGTKMMLSVFLDSESSARYAKAVYNHVGDPCEINFELEIAVPDLVGHVIRVRAGTESSGRLTLNGLGSSGARVFGTCPKSILSVEEFFPSA